MITKIDHVVITTKDIASCLNFYKKLGFTGVETAGRYELFAGDFKINVHILGKELSPKAQNVTVGSADLCFITDCNLQDLMQKLTLDGLKIELGIVDRMGARGKMQSLYLRDPDGNLVEIAHYE